MFPHGFPEHLDSGMRNWNAFFYVDSFKISFPSTKCQVLGLQQKTKHCSWPEECLTQLGRKSHELQKQRGKTPWCVKCCSEKESAPTVMGVVLGCGRRLATEYHQIRESGQTLGPTTGQTPRTIQTPFSRPQILEMAQSPDLPLTAQIQYATARRHALSFSSHVHHPIQSQHYPDKHREDGKVPGLLVCKS